MIVTSNRDKQFVNCKLVTCVENMDTFQWKVHMVGGGIILVSDSLLIQLTKELGLVLQMARLFRPDLVPGIEGGK